MESWVGPGNDASVCVEIFGGTKTFVCGLCRSLYPGYLV